MTVVGNMSAAGNCARASVSRNTAYTAYIDLLAYRVVYND